MKNNLKLTTALLGLIALSGHLQAQTVNFINNNLPFYMSDGTSLLKQNSEAYIGNFNGLSNTQIAALFSSGNTTKQNYENLFSSFNVLSSLRTADSSGQFAAVFGPQAGDEETPYLFAFNGNQPVSFFNNKAMQVVVLGSLDGQYRSGNLLEIGVYEAYDFGVAAAVTFLTADPTDVNSFSFDTQDLVAGASAAIGARAIVGSGGPTGSSSFALSALSVPEPSSISLLLAGASALVALRRFRKTA